ncbi:hypothetical protein JIN84_17905 [Luteolibacter yonseiensis]|uniref:Uncharacterized protein n=1 Tax=Luteolibacter yonseiensis TaxID=1144680 RepID=A0A934R8N7_9BACT|nr:hypothetical protein [Luteolibacter yonseiensis]MBK1817500.1 hypothetical protein [Luteolibacter yonseiensis]
MDCGEVFFKIVEIGINILTLGAAGWAAWAAAGAFRKQSDQTQIAEKQYEHFTRELERSNRAKTPLFASYGEGEFPHGISFNRVQAIDVIGVGRRNLTLAEHFDGEDPRMVYLPLRNIRDSVTILNLTAMDPTTGKAAKIPFEIFAEASGTHPGFSNLYMLGYPMNSRMRLERPALDVRIIFETGDGIVEYHDYVTMPGTRIFERSNPPGFNFLVEDMKRPTCNNTQNAESVSL